MINGQFGGLEQVLGDNYKETVKTSLSLDLPMSPKFKLTGMGNCGYTGISTEFYLINKDDYWLSKNFRFLHAFFAGTQWVHLPGGFIKGNNVYNVHIPGRLNILWASVGSVISFEGKLRTNSYMAKTYSHLKSIDENTLWPDAWKITINIKDLTPNNFNTYIQYFTEGFEGNINILESEYNRIHKDNNYGLLDLNADLAQIGKKFFLDPKDQKLTPSQRKSILEMQANLKRQQKKVEQKNQQIIFGNRTSQEEISKMQELEKIEREIQSLSNTTNLLSGFLQSGRQRPVNKIRLPSISARISARR